MLQKAFDKSVTAGLAMLPLAREAAVAASIDLS